MRELILRIPTIALALTAGPVLVARADADIAARSRLLNAPNVLIAGAIPREAIDELNEIAVDFEQPIEARLVKMEVVDQLGVDHALGAPIVRADRRRISVRVGRMVPGVFTINWGTVDAEGKHLEGTYTFTFEAEKVLSGRKMRRIVN
jgi:methionine-rich copper-binding protein CopC